MLPLTSFASSSRSIQTPNQYLRPGPNPLTHKRHVAFNINSIKISPPKAPADSEKIDDPVRTMFARYQQRLREQGKKRLSYPREYKLAAIEQVKLGKTRYIYFLPLE